MSFQYRDEAAMDLITTYLTLGYEYVTEGCEKKIEPQVRRAAQDLYDAVAREVAERIRNSGTLRGRTDGRMPDCSPAADLIDPEVPGE